MGSTIPTNLPLPNASPVPVGLAATRSSLPRGVRVKESARVPPSAGSTTDASPAEGLPFTPPTLRHEQAHDAAECDDSCMVVDYNAERSRDVRVLVACGVLALICFFVICFAILAVLE